MVMHSDIGAHTVILYLVYGQYECHVWLSSWCELIAQTQQRAVLLITIQIIIIKYFIILSSSTYLYNIVHDYVDYVTCVNPITLISGQSLAAGLKEAVASAEFCYTKAVIAWGAGSKIGWSAE